MFLKFSQNSKENTCAWGSFSIKKCAKACNFIKKRLWNRCFPVNFVKFFKNNFFTEYLRQPHKMVKHTQTIRPLLPRNSLSVFDHFLVMALNWLRYFHSQNTQSLYENYPIMIISEDLSTSLIDTGYWELSKIIFLKYDLKMTVNVESWGLAERRKHDITDRRIYHLLTQCRSYISISMTN